MSLTPIECFEIAIKRLEDARKEFLAKTAEIEYIKVSFLEKIKEVESLQQQLTAKIAEIDSIKAALDINQYKKTPKNTPANLNDGKNKNQFPGFQSFE